MHNKDDTFQYFALHFDKAMSATHGSVAVKQAVFLNDALAAILALYKERGEVSGGGTGHVEVMLLAHSAGGLVARAALLLSNHPHQSVSSIVMLGSPNTRPTYTPDVSLDLLYKKVNLAWRRSMYTTSSACQAASMLARFAVPGQVPDYLGSAPALAEASGSAEAEGDVDVPAVAAVYASWDCSVNVPRTRVVSISGGEIDLEVPTPLTSLSSLAPRPQNISMETPSPQKLSYFLKPKGGYLRWIFVNIFALPRHVMSLVSWAAGSSPSPDGNSTSTNSSEVEDSNSTEVYVFRRMEEIPQDHWDEHIMPYVEPQHVSVRTSQLAGVGFPVDHKALLWCHQLVQTTTRLMTRLSETPADTPLTLAELSSKIVKLKSKYALPSWPVVSETPGTCVGGSSSSAETEDSCLASTSAPVPIAPVQEELRRNASKHFFSRTALDDERQHFLDLLTDTRPDAPGTRSAWGNLKGSLAVTALALVTAHLPTVLTCYAAVSLAVMASFVLHFASARDAWSGALLTPLYSSRGLAADMAVLIPENHLCFGSFLDLNAAILPSFLRSPLKSDKDVSALLAVMGLGALAAHLLSDSQSPLEFVRNNGLVLQWLVSYGAALALHYIVLIVLHGVRFMVDTTWRLLGSAARCSIWCKPVRRLMRPVTRKAEQLYAGVPAVEWFLFVFLVAVMVLGSVMFNQQSAKLLADISGDVPQVGRLVRLAALLYLLTYTLFVLALAAAVLWPQRGSSRLLTPMIALSLPGNPYDSSFQYTASHVLCCGTALHCTALGR